MECSNLSRFEGDFTAAAEAQLSMAELLGLVDEQAAGLRKRQEAIARCLSGEDGWREAIQALGGSFASGATTVGRAGPNSEE